MSKIEVIYLKPQDTEIVYLSSEETTIFEILEERTEKDINLKPQVTVHNNTKKQNKKPNKSVNKKTHHKKITRILSLFVIMSLFGVAVFNLGYLPIKAFMQVPEPVGCTGEINIESYMNEYPDIKGIPRLDDIKYKIFSSDASLETVANYYKYKLKNDGYRIDYEGVITKKGITFHYYGFVKGITAVVILLTDDIEEIFGHETAVLSTTGNIYAYKDIVSWCKSKL